MKKSLYIFLAAALLVAGSACTKEIFDAPVPVSRGEMRTFTVSYGEDDETATRTELTSKGKTVWSAGDKLWISNGVENDTLTVANEFAGQRYFEFSTTLDGTIYVVYPLSAVPEDGALDQDKKFILEAPETQNGVFGEANISVAVATDRYVRMKNVTSVLKFRIPSDAKAPVASVVITGAANPVVGTFAVDMSDGSPVVTTSDTCSVSSLTVNTNGLTGNFYATVIPGTYNAGFSMTAVTLDLDHAVQSIATSAQKELAVNDFYDLGRIGDDLKPLGGNGTEAAPYLVANRAELLMLAAYVNSGKTMEGQYVKVTEDISGVTTPIGVYDVSDPKNEIIYPFCGDFDGNGKTIDLAIKQTGNRATGLFAYVENVASIHDVVLSGSVKSAGSYTAGLVGYVVDKFGVSIRNCTNKAEVSGGAYAGGLVGRYDNDPNSGSWQTSLIEGCTNAGNVTGGQYVAGIAGHAYKANINNSKNTGNITGTSVVSVSWNYVNGNDHGDMISACGVAGVAGFAQNVNITGCSNSGNISAPRRAGGVAGGCYWANVTDCVNEGTVSTTADVGVCGGVVADYRVQGSAVNCVNNGAVVGSPKSSFVGGVIGLAAVQYSSSSERHVTVQNCLNKGRVTVENSDASVIGVGGVVGYAFQGTNVKPNTVDLYGCVNEGEVKVTGNGGLGVAGIVGRMYDYYNWTGEVLHHSKNTGNITGNKYVGGILGYFRGRSTKPYIRMFNCENHGNILSVDGYSGGIFGGTYGSPADCGTQIQNCYNTGKVQYTNVNSKTPYVGGISGDHGGGNIRNCYNGGVVELLDATPNEDAVKWIGAIAGRFRQFGNITDVYYLSSTNANVVGPSSAIKPAAGAFSACTADGVLEEPVVISSVSYSTLVEALNAYIGTNTTFYKWTAGPKFASSNDFDLGGGLDLGNGGNI